MALKSKKKKKLLTKDVSIFLNGKKIFLPLNSRKNMSCLRTFLLFHSGIFYI